MTHPRPHSDSVSGGVSPQASSSDAGRAAAILRSITDGYHVVDAQGRFTEINAAARETFLARGIDPDSLIGKRIFDEVVTEARDTEAAKALEKTLRERVPTNVEHFYEPWQRWHLVRHFPTPDGGVATFFHDFTERKLLNAAEETFRHLVENSPFGVYVVDDQFRLVKVSLGAQKVFKNVRPLLGRDFSEVMRFLWLEPFASETLAIFRHTLDTGEPYQSSRTVERRHDIDATEAYDWKVERITLPDGHFAAVCHFYDLSERQAAAARSNFLNQLSQKLASLNDVQEIQDVSMRELGEFLAVQRCYFVEVSSDDRRVEVIAEWRTGGINLVGSYRARDYGGNAWWDIASRQSLGIDDVREHPLTSSYAERYPPLEIIGYALAPFIRDGRWVAGIGVTSDQPRKWTPEELSLLDNVIARVWPLIERARAEAGRLETETRLQRALDASEMGTFIWNVTDDRAEPDERFLVLFGLDPHDQINHAKALGGLIHPDDLERYSAAVAQAVDPAGNGTLRVETRVLLRDGSIRWLIITGQTIFEEGRIIMAGAGLNITESKRAEEQLRQSEERFRAFVTASSDSIYRMSPDWSVMYHLQGRDFIADTDDASSTWIQKYIHPDDQALVMDTIRKAIETKDTFELEHRVILTDGSLGWTFSRAIPLLDAKGEITEWFGAAADVTERKKAEEALRESESRFRNMANNSPVMIWITEPDGTCSFLSQSWYDFTGQTPAEGLGFGWVNATHPDDCQRAHDVFVQANARHSDFYIEYRLRRHDGEYRWAIDAATPRFDEDGKFLGYIGSVIDITERKLAEESLRASERRKTALIELADLLRELKDPVDLVFSATELLGRTMNVSRCGYGTINKAEETITIERDWNAPGIQSLAGVLHFRDYGSYIENLKRGEPVVFADARKDPRTQENAEALIAISAQAVVNLPLTEEGNFVALLYLNHAEAREWSEDDMAFIREAAERTRIAVERRRTEQALRESMEEAARGHQRAEMASRAKDDFLAALSHELRTPLNPVLMVASELVNDETVPEKVRADLRMIQRNIGLEARLIDDLLDLTRISRGMLQIHLETVDAHALLRHAEEIVRADMAGRSLDLRLQLEASESFVKADPARLQQVFWNLLKNAVKFTPDGGRIVVRTHNPEPGKLIIAVEDTGRGIPLDSLERIFHPFDQGDLQGRHAFGGLGLGLSISRALVDLHHGHLVAHSPGLDRGATFTVDLTTTLPRPPRATPDTTAAQEPRKLRLLVVEDDETSLKVLTQLLRRRGHEVQAASSVASALALASEHTFDLVISDLGLPDGSGLDIMREISQTYGWPGIALSGFGMEADFLQSQAAGFAMHLVKPVSSNDLARAIAAVQVLVR